MWKLLEQVTKKAPIEASNYVNSVYEKAQTLATAVQDEASTLLSSAISSTRSGPVDEILYEEVAPYQQFLSFFSVEEHTHEITRAVEEDANIRELHDAMVPLELSYNEFWCRYFFRQQQAEQYEHARQKQAMMDNTKNPEDDIDEENSKEDALDGDDEHRPQYKQPRREKVDSEKQDGPWLLEAAEDSERCAATQWRQKARDFHYQVQEIKQRYDEKGQKAMQEWEEKLQTLCDTYETKLAAATIQIREARAAGYDEGVCESQAIVESVREKAEEDMTRLRSEICEGAFEASVNEKAELMTEKKEMQRNLTTARQRIVELEKLRGSSTAIVEGEAIAELTKERDLWRVRALKMKKLKDLVQTELMTLRQQRHFDAAAGCDSLATSTSFANSDDHSKLQTRMNELQTQLANALAGSEARAREAYEKGFETGKADSEQRVKQERDQAYQEGYKKAQSDVKSEIGVLKAEIKMFRAFHESAVHCADHIDGNAEGLLDNSLDKISLAEGQSLCSPTSSVSIYTDNGKNDSSCSEIPKSTDDWGEW
ncbi:unnamed protein product [Peronospora effusa]|uniref:BSD domain-containing protein n=1 Tax=Peronospora effusa TaxID=542832 RepID=A0A3M6VJ57_9STRA|nr:hypothetical protein DD238_004034 [Peronospora effusa]RQM14274.1 hypothetical protein DD237_005144 [Peronospora effusa]CAI5701155.1 unnamed protein product [Peronospora effusa]